MPNWAGRKELEKIIDDWHVEAVLKPPPPTPQPKTEGRLSECMGVYTYGDARCVCKVCNTPETPKKRYSSEKRDPYDTEYVDWKVDAGLIEPYFRKELIEVRNSEYVYEFGAAKARFIKENDIPDAPVANMQLVKLPEPKPVYRDELRWRYTELGKSVEMAAKGKPIKRTVPSGREYAYYDDGTFEAWDAYLERAKPAVNTVDSAGDMFTGALICIILPMLIIGAVGLLVSIPVIGIIPMIPAIVIIFGFLTGRLIPSYVKS